ncbi:MAG: DUF159 family protein [Pelagibacterales bacterium]|nr:DUF159 family protein [Pelagibacterales bacterium]PPR17134.1 MAG: putative SOS response-associated peptidase YedK [Alphaproteobacteria bacterium MarineAlpha9_Bin3]|tara:strand:- start:5901 stop:6464 length:564 start_codon:yes stop_codon:yes gene_type:complete
MCGRFTLKNKKAVKEKLGIDIKPNYNIAPLQKILIFDGKLLSYINWSYSPVWAKRPMNLINARNETLNIKPSFKNCKKCLIIADGWYEWQKIDNKKIPFYHFIANNFFYMAGIYNEFGCAIVTTSSDNNIKHIHHRQPLILDKENISKWLKNINFSKFINKEKINYYQVSSFVNSPLNNNNLCIDKI